MSIASVATQQANAASADSSSTTPSNALSSLSGNLDTFLNLLMTQLQNQDPTSPLDTSQFTSQLVQYSSVEQQIQTNSNLTNLIQLTQGNEVVQSSSLLGKKAEVTSDHLALQDGAAQVKFNAPAAGPVSLVVTDVNGNQVAATTLTATAGANSFTWNGRNSAGNTEPDGSYAVNIQQTDSSGNTTQLPTTIVGTVTGVTASGTDVTVSLGALSVDFSKLTSLASS